MQWAVISGQHEMARMLWERSAEPLRAALMASQLCRMLSEDDSLRADHDELLEQSEAYESLAIRVLDAIRESSDAAPLLTLVPWAWHYGAAEGKPPRRVLLWPSSVLESSASEDGLLSVPCRLLVAHRHSQFTLEQYFAGDYAGSRVCIPATASLVRICLQSLLFFLPGTLVEIKPCSRPANKQIKGAPVAAEYEELVRRGMARHVRGSSRELGGGEAAGGTNPSDGIEWA